MGIIKFRVKEIRMKLVRYREEKSYETDVFSKNWLQDIPAIEGIFIVSDYELELLRSVGEVSIGEILVQFSKYNLEILSEDEGEITLFKKWNPEGFSGFPWKTHFIEREAERLMELGWNDYEENFLEDPNSYDGVLQKSLPDCLNDRKIKEGWQLYYIRGWQWAEPGKEYPFLQTIPEPTELTEARKEKKRKRAEKKRESDRCRLQNATDKSLYRPTTLTYFPQGKFPNEKEKSPWYRNE